MIRRTVPLVADSGPVVILAGIAAAGSFTHIRDTAREHGQGGWMAWAVAVCVDLTCVMAARERQRDKRTGRATRPLSWPTLVLVGGILLSLAANLAQAQTDRMGLGHSRHARGRLPRRGSMLERRAADPSPTPVTMAVPPSFGTDNSVLDTVSAPSPSPALVPARHDLQNRDMDDQDESGAPSPSSSTGPAPALLDFARRVSAEHHAKHGRPITRDALRARLGVSNALASELLRHIRTAESA
jgi:hypothetical protein